MKTILFIAASSGSHVGQQGNGREMTGYRAVILYRTTSPDIYLLLCSFL